MAARSTLFTSSVVFICWGFKVVCISPKKLASASTTNLGCLFFLSGRGFFKVLRYGSNYPKNLLSNV